MLPEIRPGTIINNRYQIQKILGQGAFGRTYLALDSQRFGEPCVLKEFVPANRQEYILRKSRELFEREAKILYQINHPQIPKFLAWLTEQDRLFIVQEYINGKTYSQLLSDRFSQGKPFSEAEVIQWLINLLPVLEYLHQGKIIHRDISLENVMLPQKQTKPVLIDFGVVKDKFTQIISPDSQNFPFSGYSVVGKVGYSPPEQIRMGYCYPCSDLYALGVSAVVLLTGKMPYKLMNEYLEWQWHSYINISDSLARILEKMLAEKPSERYQSAQELLAELQLLILAGNRNISNSPIQNQPQITNNIGSKAFKQLEQWTQNYEEKTQTPTGFEVEETNTIIESAPDIDIINNQPAQPEIIAPKHQLSSINSKFLEHCQQELINIIGPFASFIIEDTLAKFPQITPEQLVETLAAEIPHQQRAIAFIKQMQKFILR